MTTYDRDLEQLEEIRRESGPAAMAGGLLTALALGAAIGMLTAPDEGTKTRRRLQKRLRRMRGASRLERLGEAGARARRRLRKRWDELSEEVGRRAKDGTWRAKDGTRRALATLEDRLEDLEARLADAVQQARVTADEAVADVAERVAETPHTRRRRRRLLGFLLGSAVTYFLVSDRTAETRAQVKEAADRARRRANDEWERFKERRGDLRRTGDRIVGGAPSA